MIFSIQNIKDQFFLPCLSVVLVLSFWLGQDQVAWSGQKKEKAKERVDLYGDPLPPGVCARFGTTRFQIPLGDFFLSPDNKWYASEEKKNIRISEFASGKTINEIEINVGLYGGILDISPDSKFLAIKKDNEVMVLAVKNAKALWRQPLKENASSVGLFSRNGRFFIMPWVDHHMLVFDARTGKEIRRQAARSKECPEAYLEVSPSGQMVAGLIDNHTLRIWDLESGKPIKTSIKQEHTVTFYSFSQDEKFLAFVQNDKKNTIYFLEILTGKQIKVKVPEEVYFSHLRFFSKGPFCVIPSSYNLFLINTKAGSCQQFCKFHSEIIRKFNISPDDSKIVVHFDKYFQTIGVKSKKVGPKLFLGSYSSTSSRTSAFTSDGREYLVRDGEAIRKYDMSSDMEVVLYQGHANGIRFAISSPNGKLVATACDSLRIWEVATGKQLHVFHHKKGNVDRMAFSPDGKMVASFGGDFQGSCLFCAQHRTDRDFLSWAFFGTNS